MVECCSKTRIRTILKRPWNGTYGFNDYVQSVPLAVYDIDGATPRRLTLGFLENNASGGRVNGVYDPIDLHIC